MTPKQNQNTNSEFVFDVEKNKNKINKKANCEVAHNELK